MERHPIFKLESDLQAAIDAYSSATVEAKDRALAALAEVQGRHAAMARKLFVGEPLPRLETEDE